MGMNYNEKGWIFNILFLYLENIYIWASKWPPQFALHKAALFRIFLTALCTAPLQSSLPLLQPLIWVERCLQVSLHGYPSPKVPRANSPEDSGRAVDVPQDFCSSADESSRKHTFEKFRAAISNLAQWQGGRLVGRNIFAAFNRI